MRVLLDANILYGAVLRDLFIALGAAGHLHVRWSDRITQEWTSALLNNRPALMPERIARLVGLMQTAVPDAEVKGFADLIEGLRLPDPDDRHVLAAAITGGCEAIVTFNLSDFPARALVPHGVRAVHPDAHLIELLDSDGPGVAAVVRMVRMRLRSLTYSVEGYLTVLHRSGLVRFVARLRTLGGTEL